MNESKVQEKLMARIKEVMTEQGITESDLAKLMNKSRNTVGDKFIPEKCKSLDHSWIYEFSKVLNHDFFVDISKIYHDIDLEEQANYIPLLCPIDKLHVLDPEETNQVAIEFFSRKQSLPLFVFAPDWGYTVKKFEKAAVEIISDGCYKTIDSEELTDSKIEELKCLPYRVVIINGRSCDADAMLLRAEDLVNSGKYVVVGHDNLPHITGTSLFESTWLYDDSAMDFFKTSCINSKRARVFYADSQNGDYKYTLNIFAGSKNFGVIDRIRYWLSPVFDLDEQNRFDLEPLIAGDTLDADALKEHYLKSLARFSGDCGVCELVEEYKYRIIDCNLFRLKKQDGNKTYIKLRYLKNPKEYIRNQEISSRLGNRILQELEIVVDGGVCEEITRDVDKHPDYWYKEE